MLKNSTAKPPYQVPSMVEIAAIPWNGFTVADLFSGCGGSCTGFRMAGFRVGYACEFVPAAQESYKANADAGSYLDCRDVRTVQASEILEHLGMTEGELDVLSGSPPCQAFSTAGKREKGWGKLKEYEHGAKQCNETLFAEYIRLLRGLRPKVFVAENVSGLIKGTAKGMFLEILRDLKASGYNVKCKVLDAQWLGVPQTRQRTIFIGVRDDLQLEPVYPKPLPYRYSVRDALPWIVGGMNGNPNQKQNPGNTFPRGTPIEASKPLPCVQSFSGGLGAGNRHEVEAETDISRYELLPPSRLKDGAYGVQEVKPDEPCPTVTCSSPGNDLAVPYNRAIEKETDISRYAIGAEWDKLKPGEASSKYFSCVKVDPEQPCNSIMASSGSFPSAAQPLHPTEKRKFTIAELKRICAFSDDFILCGSYSQQWERLGNSVPPLMMKAVAEVIRDQILSKVGVAS